MNFIIGDRAETELVYPQKSTMSDHGSTATVNARVSSYSAVDKELALTPTGGEGNDTPSTSDNIHRSKSVNPSSNDAPFQTTDTVPRTCEIYVTFHDDNRQWVFNTLGPLLKTLNVKMVTIDDAIPGKYRLAARSDLIKGANKTIIVISKQSIKDKYFLSDINKVLHEDPYSESIILIPILYGDVTDNDIPEIIKDRISIRHNDPNFTARLTKSIKHS